MSSITSSKYTHDDRKYIGELIENLDDDNMYTKIFDILIKNSGDLYTKNNNGIFLNLSVIDDQTLDQVYKYLKKVNKNKTHQIEVDVDIIPGSTNDTTERTYKLSNYEKNILRQRNLKKVLNEDSDYQEMKIENSKSKTKSAKSKAQPKAQPKATIKASAKVTSKKSTKKPTKKSLHANC
jgi:hypothetical protein